MMTFIGKNQWLLGTTVLGNTHVVPVAVLRYILMKLFFSTAIVSIFHRNTVVFTVFLRIFCHTEKIEDSPKRLLW